MESIAQLVRVRKRGRVEATPHAVIFTPKRDYWSQCGTKNLRGSEGVDGRIKGLSAKSLLRLRDAIARTSHTSGEYRVYGSCLTIPWGSKDPQDPTNPTRLDASKIWRNWTHNLGRLLDELMAGIIYRVELQTRRAVHWHLMIYLDSKCSLDTYQKVIKIYEHCASHPDFGIYALCTAKKRKRTPDGIVETPMIDTGSRGDVASCTHQLILQILRWSWVKTLKSYHDDLKLKEAWGALVAPVAPGAPCALLPDIKTFDYCFDTIPLDGVKSGIAYLASHTTKHKQDQLGYDGKQWGYLGRKFLCQPKPLQLDGFDEMPLEVRSRAYRLIRHWVKVNRPLTDWKAVEPRRRSPPGDADAFFYSGLVVRNLHALYLFGTPREVVSRAFDCAINSIGG